MPQLALPGGKARKEKYLRAEQKNRLERTRLDLNQKFFDREAFKTKFRIDREKKLVLRAFDLVKRTSGASDEGCPPIGKHDRDYEKSVVFKNGLRLTELRLNNWRQLEKDLHGFLSSIERDMEKDPVDCSQKERFQLQEAHCNLLMKGIGLRPTKVPPVSKSVKIRPRSPEQDVVGSDGSESESCSYSYGTDSEEESEDTESVSSDCCFELGHSVKVNTYNGINSGSEAPPKKVTFVRPHTTGNLVRARSQDEHSRRSQTPTVVEETHFVITKGGFLMNTGGQYKSINVQKKYSQNSVETASTASASTSRNGSAMPQRYNQIDEVTPPSPVGQVYNRSARGRFFSQCSENNSLAVNLQNTSKFRSAPSPIGHFPKRFQIPEDRPNNRLGIFLPPEKEFLKRQHFSNRELDGISPRSVTSDEICGWKKRLINGRNSKVRIRSMRSMATVLRAAMAFSRKARQSILTDMVKEEENTVYQKQSPDTGPIRNPLAVI